MLKTRTVSTFPLFFFSRPWTYIVLKTLDLLNAVVTQIDLFQAFQLLQSFNDRQSVRLDAQNLELLQGREVLLCGAK
jgi:hypothetical protein